MRRRRRDVEVEEERFRLLVESVVEYAIYMLDPDGIVLSWNVGIRRLKGYERDEIVGRSFATFFTEEDRAAGLPQQLLDEAREKGQVKRSGWRVRKDGTRFWADIVLTAMRDADGELAGFAKVTRDMTETHRAEEEREQALADKTRNLAQLEALDTWRRDFVGSILHDLQGPVLAIAGFAGLMLDAETDPEVLGDVDPATFPQRILSNARSLEALIDHLRTFTLLESGGIHLDVQAIELEPFLSGLVADLAPVLGDHEVELDLGPASTVSADPRGLDRVLRNLLGNAARHSPVGSVVRIGAEADDGMVTVSVEDDGEGVPADLLPRIFDRFAHGGRGGTGLGLSIVKQYVELHGGRVWAESEVGAGATFRFTLPRA